MKARRWGLIVEVVFKMVELVLTVVEDEYNLLCDLAPLTLGPLVAHVYGASLGTDFGVIWTMLGSLIGLIKWSLHKHTFLPC